MATSGKTRLAEQRSQFLSNAVAVGRYPRHEEAQAAVDLLAERGFPIQHLSIVGTDLRQVEHVVGPLSYGRVALSGALQGAFFGVIMALLMVSFAGDDPFTAFATAIPLGIGFWMIMALFTYSRSGTSKNFTAVGHLQAGSYELVCSPQEAQEARRLLGGQSGGSVLRPQPGSGQQPGFGQQPGSGPLGGQNWAGPQNGQPGQPSGQPGPGSAVGPWGQPDSAATAGTDQQGPSEDGLPGEPGAQPAPRREQAADYRDLPDGRPRYGLREDPAEQAPAPQAVSDDTPLAQGQDAHPTNSEGTSTERI